MPEHLRFSFAGVAVVCLPADDFQSGEWTLQHVEDITKLLGVPHAAEAFRHLTNLEQGKLPLEHRTSWDERIKACSAGFPDDQEWRHSALRDLLVLVALLSGYDARTRITFRCMAYALGLPWQPRLSCIESLLARKAHDDLMIAREKQRLAGPADKWRNVKIGAAMIGGGGLLAITGGLAAPAVAAGIAASGGIIGAGAATAIGAYATLPFIATLFGATGAGLMGAKMDRRTRGLEEFQFECEGQGTEMGVTVCIAGLITDEYDFERAWGVDPKKLPPLERLQRYYAVFNKSKIDDVPTLLKQYEGRETELCDKMKAVYGRDPRRPLTQQVVEAARTAAATAAAGDSENSSSNSSGDSGDNTTIKSIQAVIQREHSAAAQSNAGADARAVAALMSAVLKTATVCSEGSENNSSNNHSSSTSRRSSTAPAAAAAAHSSEVLDDWTQSSSDSPKQRKYSITMPWARKSSAASPNTSEVTSAKTASDSPVASDAPVTATAADLGTAASVNSSSAVSNSIATAHQTGDLPQPLPLRAAAAGSNALDSESHVQIRVEQTGSTAAGVSSHSAAGASGLPLLACAATEPAASTDTDSGKDSRSSSTAAAAGSSSSSVADNALRKSPKAAAAAAEQAARDDELARHRVWFFNDVAPRCDQYTVRWESALLKELGRSVQGILKEAGISAFQHGLAFTALAALMSAITVPMALMSFANYIDQSWTLGCQRADAAGKLLADVLLQREQGLRPVTLIGSSLGGRVVFKCLEEMARRHALWVKQQSECADGGSSSSSGNKSFMSMAKGMLGASSSSSSSSSGSSSSGVKGDACSAAGIIENVVILGAPCATSAKRWEAAASVVHGRVINGYSANDIILGVIYRAKQFNMSTAGLQAIASPRVESIDLSDIITQHLQYNSRMPEVLSALALDDCSKYTPQQNGESPVFDKNDAAATATASGNSSSSSGDAAIGAVSLQDTDVDPFEDEAAGNQTNSETARLIG